MSTFKMVSVCMITYNHEKYIAQAIDSVLMQKTIFDFEIVIGEDCSTDRTREILLEYKEKYPDKIKLLLQEKNVGMMQNFIDTYSKCSGKYIALLEGDDYWTDPYKLQKQVDFLEAHQEYSMCFTNRTVIDSEGKVIRIDKYPKDLYNTIDIITYGFIAPTQTIVFRKESALVKFLSKHINFFSGDLLVSLFFSLIGDLFHLDINTAIYRITNNGMATSKDFISANKNFITDRNYITSIVGLEKNNFLVAYKGAGHFWYYVKKNLKNPLKLAKDLPQYYNFFLKPFSILEIYLATKKIFFDYRKRRKET